MRLQLAELVGMEAPAGILGRRLVLDDRAARHAADVPVEHAERGGTAQAVAPGDLGGRRADRPAIAIHTRLGGAATAPFTARRWPAPFDVTPIAHPVPCSTYAGSVGLPEPRDPES